MRTERAREIGGQAIDWLIANPEQLSDFVGWSGVSPGDLAHLVDDPDFATAVLEFVLCADTSVLAFANAAHLRPEEPGIARMVLAGPDAMNWT